LVVLIATLLSPLPYWGTGIGQSAAELSAEISRLPDRTLTSSPKAQALHRLTLPMRIERLLIYPLLLISFQLSGASLALRRWLGGKARQVQNWRLLPGKGLLLARLVRWLGRRMPRTWRQRLPWPELIVMLLFVFFLDLAVSLVHLPFSVYSGFVLAHQFGLSTQTLAGWAADWIKNLLLGLAMNIPLWTGFYGLMRLMPRRWPLPAGALMILVSAVLVLITPVLITPLFYEVRPLEDPTLRTRILALADRAGMQVDEVYVINASAKTTRVNAYFTGFGDARRIVLYDTLLAGYSPDQVEVVLAHEMGHWYHRHVLLWLLGMGAAGWIGLFGLRWLLNRTWQGLGLSGPADVAGLPYVMAVLAVVTTLALPAQNSLSRVGERQADRFSLATSQKPEVFVELFERFAVQNLSVVAVPAWEKFLFYTHPPIVERVHVAESIEQD
jgi:STE24 endopeptidase